MPRCLVLLVALVCAFLVPPLAQAQDSKALRMIWVNDAGTAQRLLKQLRQGASFSAMAGEHSLGAERRTWGYSGTVNLAEVQPEFRQVLRKLREGEISDVLQLGGRFAIVKVISPRIEQHYEAADRATEAKKPEQAVRELEAALRLEKDNVEALMRLGIAYDNADRPVEAMPHLEQAQQYVPWATQIMMLRGAVYTRAAIAKNNKTYARNAIAAYEEALKTDASLAPAVHFGIGKVHMLALKQPEQAVGHLEKAIKNTPAVPQVYGLLIQACYETRRYRKAWDYLRVAQGVGIEFPKLRAALQQVDQGKR